MAREFLDDLNRRWELRVDANTVDDVRTRFQGLDLPSLFAGDMERLASLLNDPVMLRDVLACILERQLEKAGLSLREFGSGMASNGLRRAGDALAWSIADFFPDPKKEMLHNILQKMSKADEAVGHDMRGKLEAITPEMMVEAAMKSIPTRSAKLVNDSSGNAPESSGSIPDRSRSANLSA